MNDKKKACESRASSTFSNLICKTIFVFSFFVKTEYLNRIYYSKTMKTLQYYAWSTNWASLLPFSKPCSEIWLLGVCYRNLQEEGCMNDFLQDFSSRIRMTYRRGFEAIGGTIYSSDSGWGCMIRSGQMLVAQALVFHHLGRSWRRQKGRGNQFFSLDEKYLEILQYFGDEPSERCPLSIHNILEAGKEYGSVAGQWWGPYACCIALKNCLTHNKNLPFSMAVYVVNDGGGSPILCIDKAMTLWGTDATVPLLILIPLVLGVGKINERYVASICRTFRFPQCLGILGGKPGKATYIVGVQDDKAIFLDPHEEQQAVLMSTDNFEDAAADSYHSDLVRYMPVSDLDPSLAIGFYCRNKTDFDDFCARASELGSDADGAALFTVSQSLGNSPALTGSPSVISVDDDWQILD